MANKVQKAVVFAVMAIGALTFCPAFAEDSQVVASLPPAVESDTALDRAINIIRENQTAKQQKVQGTSIKHSQPTVRTGHTYILGIDSASSLPM